MRLVFTVLSFALCVLSSLAQIPVTDPSLEGLYGDDELYDPNNPFADDEYDNDTTPKIDAESIPVHVEMWKLDSELGFRSQADVDTLLPYYYNTCLTEGLRNEYNYLGNLGSPRYGRYFPLQDEGREFIFLNPYGGFVKSEQDVMFVDTKSPYAFKDAVYQTLIKLCVDICKRNGKKKLLWLGDKTKTLNYSPKADEMVLTVHRWFANKSCPGDWLYARLGDLASKVTASLADSSKPAASTGKVKAGNLVTITGGTYYGGKAIPAWVKKLKWYVLEVSGDRAVINKDESGKYAIMSPVKVSDLAVAGEKPASTYRTHTVVKGDTLWDIAERYLGKGSRYSEIKTLNGLTSNVIYSGQKLKIPN